MDIEKIALAAKKAQINNSGSSGEVRKRALGNICRALTQNKEEIFCANLKDVQRSTAEGLSAPLLKRLKFDEAKLRDVVFGIETLIDMPDPVGKILDATVLDDGLELYKVSCPIGVIGVIFESRPDALVQISALCLKSGNSVILKGGSEARESNRILASIIHDAAVDAGISEGWLGLLESRQDVDRMLMLDDHIDLLIPRGSNEFVRYIMDNSRIPVLGHADGICHCFVDEYADLDMAQDVVEDSKLQYTAVCNALETLLVHEAVAKEFLPLIKKRFDKKDVVIYGCDKTRSIIDCEKADENTYRREYLDYAISVKVVGSLKEAIDHINTYGSGHTDAIITDNKKNASEFVSYVDSGNVFVNCSTRFSDGFRYGFGAEVGISTNKIHARGPVGIEGLMIYKYKLIGSGQTVKDYAEGTKKFKHKKINGEEK